MTPVKLIIPALLIILMLKRSSMRLSETGKDIIRNLEGLRLTKYPDGSGFSIGYGHQIKPGENIGDKITERVADNLFQKDVLIAERIVNTLVKAPLSQFEFDALVSFVYNIGGSAFNKSTMLKYINQNRKDLAALEFDRWVYSKGQIMPGLVARRNKEKNLFTA